MSWSNVRDGDKNPFVNVHISRPIEAGLGHGHPGFTQVNHDGRHVVRWHGTFLTNPRCNRCGSFSVPEKAYSKIIEHESVHIVLATIGEFEASEALDRAGDQITIDEIEETLTTPEGVVLRVYSHECR